MFFCFKYLELTRHQLYTKTKRVISDYAQTEDKAFNKLTEVGFSSALSLFLTYLAEMFFTNMQDEPVNVCRIIGLFFLAIIIYGVLFFLISKAYSFITTKIKQLLYKNKVHSYERSAIKIKELIDDFDHIAFDHLIVATELIKEVKGSMDVEIGTFCFHEAVYYLKTAVNKTKEITEEDKRYDCLNIKGNTNGVDVFRLVNAQRIMWNSIMTIEELFNDSGNTRRIQEYDENDMKETLRFQINELKEDIIEVGRRCDQALNEIKPD